MKNNRIALISILIIILSLGVLAYSVSVSWTFDKPNYDVELYRCTGSSCTGYDSQLISAVASGYTYTTSYTADGQKYHAAFFYEQCYRPNGYIISTESDFDTSVNDTFEKKDYCKGELDPLTTSISQTQSGQTITIKADVKSAFTVSDDTPGSPKFYPNSHIDFWTSDIRVQMFIDDVLKSEQTLSLYQDTEQQVEFIIDGSTLTPGTHTIRIQTDPIDCICNQQNKQIKQRTVEIEIEQPPQINTPPVIDGIPDKPINEDSGYWDDLIDLHNYANDNETTDKNQLTFAVVSQTNKTVVDCIIDSNRPTYPNRFIDCATLPNKNGYSDVTVRVTDPEGLYDEDTFRVTITPVNDAPGVSNIPNQSIDSCHQFITFDLDDYVTDVDNNPSELTWTYSGDNYLDVNINSAHVVTITYPSWFRGSETITFTAADLSGATGSNNGTFTVTECPTTNTAPTIDVPNQTYQEDSGLHTIDLHNYASDNETTDKNQLTFARISQSNTSVVNCDLRNNRYLDCTTQMDKNGSSYVTVSVTDPQGLYDEDTFRIDVLPVNDGPHVNDITNQSVDSCHQFQTFDLDDYITDVDNSPEQINWTYSGNSQLIVSVNSEHIVTITYPQGFTGTETIRFTATDLDGLHSYDDATYSVTQCNIPPPNTPPELDIPNKRLDKDSGLNSNVVDLWLHAQDNESEDDELTFTIINETNTSVVDCTIRDDQYVDCTVQPNMTGYSDVTIKVEDEGQLYDEDTFRVEIVEKKAKKDPEVEPSVMITQVVYDDKVKQGGYLNINIYVEGKKVKNTQASITIPELGIEELSNSLKNIEVRIPEDAEPGVYSMGIWVKSNHNEEDTVYRDFFVQPKKSSETTKMTAAASTPKAETNQVSKIVTGSGYKNDTEKTLSLIAVSLAVILVIILVLIIVALTTKK